MRLTRIFFVLWKKNRNFGKLLCGELTVAKKHRRPLGFESLKNIIVNLLIRKNL